MLDFLLAMLAQRYFHIFQIKIKTIIPILFYSTQIITNLTCTILAIGFIIADLPSETASLQFLSTHTSNSAEFLAAQPSLIVSNHENRAFSFGFFLAGGFFGATRTLSFGYFLYQNTTLPRKTALSPTTRRQHRMLINAVCAQLLGITIFLTFPLFVIICFIQFPSVLPKASKVWVCLLTFLSNFIFYDFFVTLYCVIPYRKFVLQFFSRSLKPSIIQSVWSTTAKKSYSQAQ